MICMYLYVYTYMGMSLEACNMNVFHIWVAVKKFESCPKVHKSKVTFKPIVHLYNIGSQEAI